MSNWIPFFVLAGNNREYVEYLKKARINNSDKGYSIIFLDDPVRLRGYSDIDGVAIGTWYKRPDIAELFTAIRVCQRSPEKIEQFYKLGEMLTQLAL